MDNNYPPYTFLDEKGQPQGILIDRWRLWEQKTGIKVEITTLDWGQALQRMAKGEFDVIDTIFFNEERAKLYDFGKPYEDIEVPVYFRNNISGIVDAEDLQGFSIAVKSGDNAIYYLKQHGINRLIEYPSYESIVQAAKERQINLFMIDKPPAEYFLAKYDIANQFKSSPPFYTGQFHRAVKKGNNTLLEVVENGFTLISNSEYKQIDNKWLGTPPINPTLARTILITGLSIGIVVLLLSLWNTSLRAKVKQRTAELNALFMALPDVVIVFNRDGRYLNIPTPNRRLLVRDAHELLGKTVQEVLPADVAETHFNAIQQSFTQEQPVMIEYPLTIQGEEIWFSGAVKALDDKRTILVARDLSDRKKKEDALQQQETELRRVNRLLRTLSECNQILVRTESEAELVQSICETLVNHGDYPFVWIGFIDPKTSEIFPVASAGIRNDYTAILIDAFTKQMHENSVDFSNFCSGERFFLESVSALQLPDDIAGQDIIHSYAAFPLKINDEEVGCFLVYSERYLPSLKSESSFLLELAGDITFGIRAHRQQEQQRRTEIMLAQANENLIKAYEATIEGWARALEYHEQETAGHSRRVVELMLKFGKRLGFHDAQLLHLRYGALLHDIGKMVIPTTILNKPGPLAKDEWEIMLRHPVIAYELLKDIAYLMPSLDIPYSHHEWWDGSGYPNGLSGEEIPLAARMFALVDVYDALISDRPYRKAFLKSEAVQLILSLKGKQFDPQLTDIFLNIITEE